MAGKPERPEIVIKHNKYARHGACALCNADRPLSIGPCLFLDGTWEGVCEACAHVHAPGLAAMLCHPEAQRAYWVARGEAEMGADDEGVGDLQSRLTQLSTQMAAIQGQIDRLRDHTT